MFWCRGLGLVSSHLYHYSSAEVGFLNYGCIGSIPSLKIPLDSHYVGWRKFFGRHIDYDFAGDEKGVNKFKIIFSPSKFITIGTGPNRV